jgi:hypothetical protein
MRKRVRSNSHKLPRLPFVVLGLFFLALWILMIVKVDPVILVNVLIPGYYLPFFVLLWLWSGLLIYAVFLNLIRAVVWSTAIILFSLLRLNELGNILNALLILSIVISIEFVLRHNRNPNVTK